MISIPFGTSTMPLEVPAENLQGVYASAIMSLPIPENQSQIIQDALDHPFESPPLPELASHARTCCLILPNYSRPFPLRTMLTQVLSQLRKGNASLNITLLVASAPHCISNGNELILTLGDDIVSHEQIALYDCSDESSLVSLGPLPSGSELKVNRLAAETDLLLAVGIIEPDAIAGFTGGPEAILPGIASHNSQRANHCGKFIAAPQARTGRMQGNPIHEDRITATRKAKLAFILNAIVSNEGTIMRAFAGNPILAHEQGCDCLRKLSHLAIPPADIAITSNGGHPLDRTLCQAIRGMTAAEAATNPGGIIIMAAECKDGHGGEHFYQTMATATSPQRLYRQLSNTPQDLTEPQQWEAQILARLLARNHLILVTDQQFFPCLDKLRIRHAGTVQEALRTALKLKGTKATVAVIPDGLSVIVN